MGDNIATRTKTQIIPSSSNKATPKTEYGTTPEWASKSSSIESFHENGQAVGESSLMFHCDGDDGFLPHSTAAKRSSSSGIIPPSASSGSPHLNNSGNNLRGSQQFGSAGALLLASIEETVNSILSDFPLTELAHHVISLALRQPSPASASTGGSSSPSASPSSPLLGLNSSGTQKTTPTLSALLLTIRLAKEAPFENVRKNAASLLADLEKEGTAIPWPRSGVSRFINDSDLVGVDGDGDDLIIRIFQDLFIQSGRVSHIERVIAWHPSYLEKYVQAYNLITREDGPLPLPWRSFIAILSAARHKCQYLISLQEREFLSHGGDPKWLLGLNTQSTNENIPRKILNLLNLNAMLAHQPWLVTRDHVAALVKGADAWSVGELVHAMVLMATFRAMSGFVYGMGINAEIDLPFLENPEPLESEPGCDEAGSEACTQTQQVVDWLKSGSWTAPHDDLDKARVWESAGEGDAEVNLGTSPHSRSDALKYIGKHILQHKDFDVKSKEYTPFKVDEYCWKDQGYELVNTYYSDAAQLLDDEFKLIFSMTYNVFHNSRDVDTGPLRRAVWYYVHRIMGMIHDDYNYHEVNVFLHKPLKTFIKKIAVAPETLTKKDFNNLGYELATTEKCHIALLAVEARKQAELLYGLHAVMKHMMPR